MAIARGRHRIVSLARERARREITSFLNKLVRNLAREDAREHMEGTSTTKVGAFAQRLANDCRRLAAMEHDGPGAGLFEKLAQLFDEAAAMERRQAARPRGREDKFDSWFDPTC